MMENYLDKKRLQYIADSILIGTEQENIASFGLKTLFVVGTRPNKQLKDLSDEHKCRAIRLYYQGSYSRHKDLVRQILYLLNNTSCVVIMDYPVIEHDFIIKCLGSTLLEHPHRLKLVVDCNLSGLDAHHSSIFIKVSDVFGGSNGGNWTIDSNHYMDLNRFTSWQDYQAEEQIFSNPLNDVVLCDPQEEELPSSPVTTIGVSATTILPTPNLDIEDIIPKKRGRPTKPVDTNKPVVVKRRGRPKKC